MTLKSFTYHALILLVCSSECRSDYLSVLSGYHESEHQYLNDTSSQKGTLLGAELDYQHWRRKTTGWFTRGPAVKITQAPSMLAINSKLPLFQWHKHQGSWLEVNWSQQTLQTQLSEPQIFMGNDGVPISLAQDTTIGITRQFLRLQLYWHESIKAESVINLAGVSYSRELTPTISELSSTNATLFEGQFEGMGVVLGRKKDDRGLNFQWRLNIASLNSHFSDDATGHRQLSKPESSVYKVALNFSWHYRYYLAPYWYLVPKVQYHISYLTQSQLQPVDVKHESFVYSQTQSTISIQRHF